MKKKEIVNSNVNTYFEKSVVEKKSCFQPWLR